MSTWYPTEGRHVASKHTLKIFDEIEERLTHFIAPRPRVTSIRIGAGVADYHDFEVEVELAPGVSLASRYQSVDEEGRKPEALENEGGSVAWHCVDSVKEFMELGVTTLSDLFHEARVRTRKVLSEWWREGIFVTLVDIRFVRTEYWGRDDSMAVEVRLTDLNERLRPTIVSWQVDHPDLIEGHLVWSKTKTGLNFATRAHLEGLGADGWVDQLVINAVGQNNDVGLALRRAAAGQMDQYYGALTVFMQGVHVRCHGGDASNDFRWNRDSIIIFGRALPATVLVALNGRPITSIIEHPVLSDDMIITHASSEFKNGEHFIRATFKQPRRLFCSASGRVWPMPEPEDGNKPAADHD